MALFCAIVKSSWTLSSSSKDRVVIASYFENIYIMMERKQLYFRRLSMNITWKKYDVNRTYISQVKWYVVFYEVVKHVCATHHNTCCWYFQKLLCIRCLCCKLQTMSMFIPLFHVNIEFPSLLAIKSSLHFEYTRHKNCQPK